MMPSPGSNPARPATASCWTRIPKPLSVKLMRRRNWGTMTVKKKTAADWKGATNERRDDDEADSSDATIARVLARDVESPTAQHLWPGNYSAAQRNHHSPGN